MSKTRTKQQNGGKGGFRETFASARKAGKKTFAYRGKKYTTKTAEEHAKEVADKRVGLAVLHARKASRDLAKNPKSKSHKEIYQSYEKEVKKRTGISSKPLANYMRHDPKTPLPK